MNFRVVYIRDINIILQYLFLSNLNTFTTKNIISTSESSELLFSLRFYERFILYVRLHWTRSCYSNRHWSNYRSRKSRIYLILDTDFPRWIRFVYVDHHSDIVKCQNMDFFRFVIEDLLFFFDIESRSSKYKDMMILCNIALVDMMTIQIEVPILTRSISVSVHVSFQLQSCFISCNLLSNDSFDDSIDHSVIDFYCIVSYWIESYIFVWL